LSATSHDTTELSSIRESVDMDIDSDLEPTETSETTNNPPVPSQATPVAQPQSQPTAKLVPQLIPQPFPKKMDNIQEQNKKSKLTQSADRLNSRVSSKEYDPLTPAYDPRNLPRSGSYNYNEPTGRANERYSPSRAYEPRRKANSRYSAGNYGYQDDYYRSNAYHSGGYDQSSRFSSQYYQSTSYDPYEYEYHPRGRNSSFRQQSDPSLVINMNEVSDSDSESDSQTPKPSHQQSAKAPAPAVTKSKPQNQSTPSFANRGPAAIEQELKKKRDEIERLQRVIAETEKKQKIAATKTPPQSTRNQVPTPSKNQTPTEPSVLQKRKRIESEEERNLKQFKIDIDVTHIQDLTKRVKEREETLLRKKHELRSVHEEADQLLEDISSYDTKSRTCSSRVALLQEKLRVLQLQLEESNAKKKAACALLGTLQERVTTLEQDYREQRNFLEQERIVLCELEIEEKFGFSGVDSSPVSPTFRKRSFTTPVTPATPNSTQTTPLATNTGGSSNTLSTPVSTPAPAVSTSAASVPKNSNSTPTGNNPPTVIPISPLTPCSAANQLSSRSGQNYGAGPNDTSNANKSPFVAPSTPLPQQNQRQQPKQRSISPSQQGNQYQPQGPNVGNRYGSSPRFENPNRPSPQPQRSGDPNINRYGNSRFETANRRPSPQSRVPTRTYNGPRDPRDTWDFWDQGWDRGEPPRNPAPYKENPRGYINQPPQAQRRKQNQKQYQPYQQPNQKPKPKPKPKKPPLAGSSAPSADARTPTESSPSTPRTTPTSTPNTTPTPTPDPKQNQNPTSNTFTKQKEKVKGNGESGGSLVGKTTKSAVSKGTSTLLNLRTISNHTNTTTPMDISPVIHASSSNDTISEPPSDPMEITNTTKENSPAVSPLATQPTSVPTQEDSRQILEKHDRLLNEIAEKHSKLRKILESKGHPPAKENPSKPNTPVVEPKKTEKTFVKLGSPSFQNFDTVKDYLLSPPSCFSDLPLNVVTTNDSTSPLAETNGAVSSSRILGEYNSPLMCFRSYRMSPNFQLQGKSITGPELMYDINPSNILCRFEIHGTCNDDECPWAHFRDLTRSTSEVVDLCATYARLRTNKKELSPQIDSLLTEIHKQIKFVSADTLICNFVQQVNKLASDNHYIPLLCPPTTPKTPKRTTKQTPQSSTQLLGLGKVVSARRPKNVPPRIIPIEQSDSFDKFFLQHDIVPVYDLSTKEDHTKEIESLDKRYYRLSAENYEEFLKEEPTNKVLWIHYALSKFRDVDMSSGSNRGYYDSLCVLVPALEKNPSSIELWRLYLEFFSRSGSPQNFANVLTKASAYVPYSYSVWLFRWNSVATLELKMDVLHDATVQYLRYSPATSPVLVSVSTLSESLLLFILASAHILSQAGHEDFVKTRLLRFFESKHTEKVTPTEFPFASANHFLHESQLDSLWSLLQPKEISILSLQVCHLLVFNKLACSHESFSRRLKTFSISWEEAKKLDPEIQIQRIPDVVRYFEDILLMKEIIGLKSEDIPVAVCYVSMLQHLKSVADARAACKTIVRNSPTIIEFWQLYAGLESQVDPAVGELIYKKSLLQFCDSHALWFSFASFFVRNKQPKNAITALLCCVSSREYDATKQTTKKKIQKAHEKFRDRIESSEKENIFLWLNYCLFLSLTNKSPQKIFERALLFTFRRPNLKLLFTEYLRWQISQKFSRSRLLDTLDRIFNRFGPDVESPLRDETAEELLRHKSIYPHFVFASSEDFSFLDEIVGLVVDSIPDFEGKELVLNLYLQRFPRNFLVHFKLAELSELQNNLNKARRGYTSAIKLAPCFALAWERLISLELEHNPTEVRSLLLSAMTHLPENLELKRQQTKLNELQLPGQRKDKEPIILE